MKGKMLRVANYGSEKFIVIFYQIGQADILDGRSSKPFRTYTISDLAVVEFLIG